MGLFKGAIAIVAQGHAKPTQPQAAGNDGNAMQFSSYCSRHETFPI